MEFKTQAYAKNNRSLINSNLILNENLGIILICCHGYSRTIYIESLGQVPEERILKRYYIYFPDAKVASTWSLSLDSNSKETMKGIQALMNLSHTIKEFQVPISGLQAFTDSIHKAYEENLILNGEQDADIKRALACCGQEIEFKKPKACGCVIL